ncbi:MAG: hypothetical protein WA988_19350 [Candidatus Nanopelagicales bacterium]
MGYDVTTNAEITISADSIPSIWAALGAEGSGIDTAAFNAAGSLTNKVAGAIASKLGDECEIHTAAGESAILYLWTYGPLDNPESVLSIVAAHGGTGTVEVLGDNGKWWRWLLVDNEVREETAHNVYNNDFENTKAIAQHQPSGECSFETLVAPAAVIIQVGSDPAEPALFLGIRGEGSGRQVTFATATKTGIVRTHRQDAYRYNDQWCLGSSCDVLRVVAVAVAP